jgi:hypothetical protein
MPWFIQYRAALPLSNKEIGSDLAQLKVRKFLRCCRLVCRRACAV